jgi:hypothetical protein
MLSVFALLFAISASHGAESRMAMLVKEGKNPLPIVITDTASERTRTAADDLATKLRQISGAEFTVTIASDKTDSPAIRLVNENNATTALDRERYRIRTTTDGELILTGASELAVQHAVWDLLYHFDYHHYFPGEHWEIIPSEKTLYLSMDITTSPDYASRRIWPGFGFWRDKDGDINHVEAHAEWEKRNRMGGGFRLNTGHAYGQLIRSQQATFDAHPEYYALVDGKRHVVPQAKICISNHGARDAAVAYALDYFEKHPDTDSVSIDPSDGGNWCECQDCARIGSPTDSAITLANTIAEALEKHHPDRDLRVGLYAYNYHSEPPNIDVHPKVIVSIATAFIKGGLSMDDLITGWSAKGIDLGIREYYSVNTWDRDLPGSSRGSNLDYLCESIPHFYKSGARFLTAESSSNWGCNGLGHYLATHLMWDVGEAENRQLIVDEFLDNCFGPARKPMAEFYRLIDGSKSNASARLVFDDLLGRMFRKLDAARKLAADRPKILARIDDLILYTRHAELYDSYRTSTGAERQTNFEAMIRHAYRSRDRFMMHSLALYRDVGRRDKSVTTPENAEWTVPEKDNPWKSSEPWTASEVEALLHNGITSHQPLELDFEPQEFPDYPLTRAAAVYDLNEASDGKAASARGLRSFFTVVENAGEKIHLDITGGLIAHYRDRGNVRVELWKLGGPSATGEDRTLVAEDKSVPPDGETRRVSFTVAEPGTYRIDINDGADLTSVTWPEGQPMSWKMSLEDHPKSMSGRWYLYFYVPKGADRIGLYATATGGEVHNPNGETALDFTKAGDKSGTFLSVEVPEGMDGQLWKLHHIAGNACLLNVPPFLARSADELLLPAE